MGGRGLGLDPCRSNAFQKALNDFGDMILEDIKII
jgi:hypothetical protein